MDYGNEDRESEPPSDGDPKPSLPVFEHSSSSQVADDLTAADASNGPVDRGMPSKLYWNHWSDRPKLVAPARPLKKVVDNKDMEDLSEDEIPLAFGVEQSQQSRPGFPPPPAARLKRVVQKHLN
jgi:hypothetical protein